MNPTTKQKALDALEGMRLIVDQEMLVKGEYVTDKVIDPAREGTLCGGRQYCAIGALWVGAGVRPRPDAWKGRLSLPGTEFRRGQFVSRRAGLRTALDALNAAAARYIARNGVEIDPEGAMGEDLIEDLFEAGSTDIGRKELLKIIASAKRKVNAA